MDKQSIGVNEFIRLADIEDILQSKTNLMVEDLVQVMEAIESIPRVQAKVAHWNKSALGVRVCSNCGWGSGADIFNYCPNCGAKIQK